VRTATGASRRAAAWRSAREISVVGSPGEIVIIDASVWLDASGRSSVISDQFTDY
jgi:hypothetical protein